MWSVLYTVVCRFDAVQVILGLSQCSAMWICLEPLLVEPSSVSILGVWFRPEFKEHMMLRTCVVAQRTIIAQLYFHIGQTDWLTKRLTDEQTGRRTDRQTDRRIDRLHCPHLSPGCSLAECVRAVMPQLAGTVLTPPPLARGSPQTSRYGSPFLSQTCSPL